MRKVYPYALLLLVLVSIPASARPTDPGTDRDRIIDRILRFVRTVIVRIQPNDDLMRPPLP